MTHITRSPILTGWLTPEKKVPAKDYSTTSRTSVATTGVALGRITSTTPTIAGSARVGTVLVARPGSWGPSGVKLAYRWYAGSTAIAGVTSARFRLTAKQKGKAIKVKGTGTRSGHTSASKVSASTAKVR